MNAGRSAAAGLTLLIALGLAGCAVNGQVTTGTPPPKATAAPAAGSSAAASLSGTALGYTCDELLDPTSIAAYDPTMVATPGETPAAGSSAAEAEQMHGTVCEWTGSADTLVVAAAQPDAASLATLTSHAAADGDPTSVYGSDVAGFTVGNEIQVFTADGFWASAVSAVPSSDPASVALMRAVLQALPAG